MANIGKLAVSVVADARGFESGLARSAQQLDRFGERAEQAVSPGLWERLKGKIDAAKGALDRWTNFPGLRQMKEGLAYVNAQADRFLQHRYGKLAQPIKFAGQAVDVAAMSMGHIIPGISVLGSVGAALGVEAFRVGKSAAVGIGRGIRQGLPHAMGAVRQALPGVLSSVGLGDLGMIMTQPGGMLAGIGAAAVGVGRSVINTGHGMEQTMRMASRLGTSFNELRDFERLGRMSGMEPGEMSAALEKFARHLGDAVAGSREARNTFEDLGLDWRELARIPLAERFEQTANAINALNLDAERSSSMIALFGRSGGGMDEALCRGRAGLEASRGTQRSEEEERRIERMVEASRRLSGAWSKIQEDIAIRLAPVVTTLATEFTALAGIAQQFAQHIANAVESSSTLSGLVPRLGREISGAVPDLGVDWGNVARGVWDNMPSMTDLMFLGLNRLVDSGGGEYGLATRNLGEGSGLTGALRGSIGSSIGDVAEGQRAAAGRIREAREGLGNLREEAILRAQNLSLTREEAEVRRLVDQAGGGLVNRLLGEQVLSDVLLGDWAALNHELDTQARNWGLSADRIRLNELAARGLSQEFLNITRHQISVLENQQAMGHLWEQAQQTIEATRTPLERFQLQLDSLDWQAGFGMITDEQHARAAGDAARQAGQGQPALPPTVAALGFGSGAAMNAISAARRSQGSPEEQLRQEVIQARVIAQQQLDVGRRVLAALAELGVVG